MSTPTQSTHVQWHRRTLGARVTRAWYLLILIVYLVSLMGIHYREVKAATVTFTGSELLGKPTDTSITINIVPASAIEYYYEYGISPGSYTAQTAPMTATGGQPHEVTITELSPDTRYYYRMVYDGDGDVNDGDYEVRPEYTFQTQRALGEDFMFTVTSDLHATYNSAYQNAMTNILNNLPDFNIDLGDTFMVDGTSSQSAVNTKYLAARDPLYLGKISHSVPIFLTPGNHEEEEGWNLDDTPFSSGIGSIQARKAFFPTPSDLDDPFYSANADPLDRIDEGIYGDDYREDYYAWEWGDALFVVIDEFTYTMELAYSPAAGEGNDDSFTGDQWSWTLGENQYNWLKQTLENSDARYKFVFSHHVTGGITRAVVGVGAGYVRGGAEAAALFEWGGRNADGSWGFSTERPGWGVDDEHPDGTPIHQLFVDNGVSAYFHGHDHQYVHETRDGVVYQEVPSPSMSGSGFSGIYTEGTYPEYSTIEMLPNSGHLRITVAPEQATVDYISSTSTAGTVNYSYTIEPSEVIEPDFYITASAGANGSISPSGVVGVVAGDDQSFSITPSVGYQVADVLVDDASVGSVTEYSFTNVQADHTISASFETAGASIPLAVDGTVSNITADDVSSITLNHTTGSGEDRLLLVGMAWNCGTTNQTIASVSFTPDGGSAQAMSPVITQQAGTQLRYAAIYSLLNPPSDQTGTVTINFSGSVTNGIVAGAINFAGVNQDDPLGTPGGANGNDTNPSATLTDLVGNELVFDTLFQGASDVNQTLAHGPDQVERWNAWIANTRSAASTEQASGSSVTMSWTAASGSYWAIAAVPIQPAASLPTYTLATAVDPLDGGTIDPVAGTHTYSEGQMVTVSAHAAAGYLFDHWSGACAGSGACQVTMDADKAVTAYFVPEPPTGEVTLDGVASSNTANNVSSITLIHTTGSGEDRLLLVGMAWNCGTTNQTIASVSFTPDGGSAQAMSPVITQQAGTQLRYAAIYSLLNPPSDQTGTVTINFSGSVTNGIVAGAINFAGVDQSVPFGTPVGATGSSNSSSVNLTGLDGDELIFDTAFQGASNDSQTLTPATGQTTQWNSYIGNTRSAASFKPASGSEEVTMSWTAASSSVWVIAAVPINPAPMAGTTYELTMSVTPAAGGATNPAAGAHTYSEDALVNISATPAAGYEFDYWQGDVADPAEANTTVTMDEDKSVVAHFNALPTPITFTGTELLGQPTDSSIAISAVPDEDILLYYEYGTTTGVYPNATAQVSANGGEPIVVTISDLLADTRYYYRMQYSSNGGSGWIARQEHSFYTQRAQGSTFTFDITTDSHIDIALGNDANWLSTINGVASDEADFLINLGDTFAMDNGTQSIPLGDIQAAEQAYLDQLPSFNIASASTPIYIVAGNHEQQEAWHLQGTLANSLPVMSKNAEKKFFLNPGNNSFYTGNINTYSYLSGDQLIQDYFSWTWGDALFVIISPFWTTTTKPYTTTVGGGETDATGSGDRWDWTLGLEQFNWLKTTLENSSAKYKFVFSHQIVGGNGMSSPFNQVNYGHGGVDSANLVEWGGYDVDGVTYSWNTRRPGWGSQPIRQMLEANGVTAFFHGHDHQYAYESLNGMVYQSVPSASFTGSFGIYTTGGNSGNTIWADSTQGPGRLRITVSPSQTTVDFIRYNASVPAYTYTMAPTGGPSYTLTVAADPSDAGTTVPEVGTHTFVHDYVVDVTANPAPGYHFDYWSGACSGSGTCQVTMNTDKAVTAHFEATPVEHTITATAGSGGSIDPSGNVTVPEGDDQTFTISPNSGHRVDDVLVDGVSVGSVTSYTFNQVNADHTIAAEFAQIPVNEAPVLHSIGNKTIDELTELAFTATATDIHPLHFSLVNAPSGATITANGHFAWTPNEAQGPGEYTFMVKVCDNQTPPLCDQEEITVTVNEVNIAPQAISDSYSTKQNTELVISPEKGILDNDSDADGNLITAALVDPLEHGILVLEADGSFSFTPETNFIGVVTFTYRAYDGLAYSSVTEVRIEVTGTPIVTPYTIFLPLVIANR